MRESLRPKDAVDCWILVRDSKHEIRERKTELPVEPFESEFENASPNSLAKFFFDFVKGDKLADEARAWVAHDMFVVLDERGARDQTAIVMFYEQKMPDELQEEEWDEAKVERFWKSWRCPFTITSMAVGLLTTIPHALVDMFDEDGPDENGVYHWPDEEQELEDDNEKKGNS